MNSTLELQHAFAGAYAGKRVLVTGHTGFKGSWLCEWLLALGADVTGLALPPATSPALFDQLGLAARMKHRLGDIRDLATVRAAVAAASPDFIFHLAAQPLVRLSYEQPVETYATNIMGTVNVLEALRLHQHEFKADSSSSRAVQVGSSSSSATKPGTGHLNFPPRVIAAVVVTTDKCYENREDGSAYREDEPMGGYDPYSSSKGATELVVAAYRRSYFSAADAQVKLASARAGNVIGGGDWALDRIVPDCIRALQRGEAIPVRNKVATRPWQHVLEPLSGYLWLGACLSSGTVQGASSSSRAVQGTSSSSSPTSGTGTGNLNSALAAAFNFGPTPASNRTVADLVQEALKHWPGRWEDKSDPKAVHEAKLLNLSIEKAARVLGWTPVWDFAATLAETVTWYRQAAAPGADPAKLARAQIAEYTAAAQSRKLSWSK